MSLIKCTECNREVSDKANACPNCGAPISSSENSGSSTIGIIAVCLGSASIFTPYFAAVFLVPAAFIAGFIALSKGQRKAGVFAILFAILGGVGVIATSNKISDAQKELNRSVESLRKFEDSLNSTR